MYLKNFIVVLCLIAPCLLTATRNRHSVQGLEGFNKSETLIDSLFLAIEQQNIELVDYALSVGVNPNSLDKNSRSPLNVAIKLGNEEIIAKLLANKADLNMPSQVLFKDIEITSDGKLKEITSMTMKTPLLYAINKYDYDGPEAIKIISMLLSAGANPNALDQGHSLLSLAVLSGYYEIAELLINAGADVYLKDEDFDGTPLLITFSRSLTRHKDADSDIDRRHQFAAVRITVAKRRELIAKLLLDNGANPNAEDFEGNTALHLAAESSYDYNSVKLLIDNGAHVNTKNVAGKTPLHIACDHGNRAIAQLLVESNADVNTQDNRGDTPLIAAVVHGDSSLVTLLIKKGSVVNAHNNAGWTALHCASRTPNEKLIELLINNDAQTELKNEDGNTPLHIAAGSTTTLKIIGLLIKKPLDVNIQNNLGETPLHIAAKEGHDDIVAALVANNADASVKNNENYTALDIAKFNHHDAIIELLKKAQQIKSTSNSYQSQKSQLSDNDSNTWLKKYGIAGGVGTGLATAVGICVWLQNKWNTHGHKE